MIADFNFTDEDGDDVVARIKNDSTGHTITIITADRDTLGEDGPVVTQISEDEIIVVFALQYVMQKMITAIENNQDEFGEMALGLGFSYILNKAIAAATEKFESN